MSLENIIKEYLLTYFDFNPVAATDSGYPGFDEKLPDYSQDRVEEVINKYQSFIHELSLLDLKTFDDQINSDLLKRMCEINLFGLKSSRHHILNPCSYVRAISSGLFSLIMGKHRETKEKLHFITCRLKAIPEFIEHAKEIIHKPIKLWTEIAIKEIPGVSSYLNEVIEPFLKENNVIGREQLIEQARHAIFEYCHYLENLSKTEKDFSIGLDNFEYLLKSFHGMDKSVQEIKEIGFEQIDILTRELDEQAQKIDDTKSWQEHVVLLKNNHPAEESLLKAYQNKVDEIKEFLIKHDIVTLPKEESLKIIETPEFLQNTIPYAAYSPPTMFAKDSQGIFFVSPAKGNQEVLKEHCYASFPLTAIHEAYPGHHLQFAIQRNLKSDVRKVYDIATYYEGWTLYCEEMMFRSGFYDDAMRLYQLKDRLWRAARIVVDVSIQCFGMSDAEATTFLVDNAKLSQQSARVDVNWYTQCPTIPMSYLIGMLEVDKLKEDYLNTGKNLKEFHDAFLSCGAIPLKHVREILFKNI